MLKTTFLGAEGGPREKQLKTNVHVQDSELIVLT